MAALASLNSKDCFRIDMSATSLTSDAIIGVVFMINELKANL